MLLLLLLLLTTMMLGCSGLDPAPLFALALDLVLVLATTPASARMTQWWRLRLCTKRQISAQTRKKTRVKEKTEGKKVT